jgi:DNA-binding NarL/FixJ family response regulator
VATRKASNDARPRGPGVRLGHDPIGESTAGSPTRLHLSPRQADVATRLLRGASEKEVAAETGLSVHTVHTHVQRVYRKVGARSRVELMLRLVGSGLRLPRDLA